MLCPIFLSGINSFVLYRNFRLFPISELGISKLWQYFTSASLQVLLSPICITISEPIVDLKLKLIGVPNIDILELLFVFS